MFCFLISYCIFGFLGGINIFPEWLINDSWSIGIFLRWFGELRFFVKIWTRGPPNYYQNASTNTRIIRTHHGKCYFCQSGTQKMKMFEKCMSCVPCVCVRCRFVFCKKWVHVLNINLWRWGLTIDELSNNKMYKSLDVNFISIEIMKWNFGNVYQISSGT